MADSVCEDTESLFFDADSDGDKDLYVVSGGGEFVASAPFYQDRLYVNDGKGRFSRLEGAGRVDWICSANIFSDAV